MTRPAKKRTRRPKPLRFRGHGEDSAGLLQYDDHGHETIAIYHATFRSSEAKALAAWLLRAAAYLERL
jgi:hypothetical protein